MLSRLTHHMGQNAVAYLALFVALGGSSYAAIRLPANSVGSTQIKTGAVRSSDVKNFSLLAADFKSGQLPAGQRGAPGDTGPKGDPGAAGQAGSNGQPGAAGPLLDALPTGKTLRGYYTVIGSGAGVIASTSISFAFPLASVPEAHYVQTGAAVPAGCTGTAANPGASPGHLCVFEIEVFNTTNRTVIAAVNNTADRFGAGVFAIGVAAGQFHAKGRWAVTAP